MDCKYDLWLIYL